MNVDNIARVNLHLYRVGMWKQFDYVELLYLPQISDSNLLTF